MSENPFKVTPDLQRLQELRQTHGILPAKRIAEHEAAERLLAEVDVSKIAGPDIAPPLSREDGMRLHAVLTWLVHKTQGSMTE